MAQDAREKQAAVDQSTRGVDLKDGFGSYLDRVRPTKPVSRPTKAVGEGLKVAAWINDLEEDRRKRTGGFPMLQRDWV